MLASRLPLVYLFHRYALGAAINVIGSAKVPLSLAGDGQQPVIIWPAESQKEALQLALRALNPAQLNVPAEVWRALAPLENRDSDPERLLRQRDIFSVRRMERARWLKSSWEDCSNPQRMQRLAVISRQEAQALSPANVISALVSSAFSDVGEDAGGAGPCRAWCRPKWRSG